MPRIRHAIKVLAEREHLADKPILTHRLLAERGRTLLLDVEETLIDIGRDEQLVFKEVVERAVARIEWDSRDLPVRLFPFSRQDSTSTNEAAAVVIDPKLGFGRPILARAGVSTAVVFDRFGAGDKIDDLAADFDVSAVDIEEAIRFESRLAA